MYLTEVKSVNFTFSQGFMPLGRVAWAAYCLYGSCFTISVSLTIQYIDNTLLTDSEKEGMVVVGGVVVVLVGRKEGRFVGVELT